MHVESLLLSHSYLQSLLLLKNLLFIKMESWSWNKMVKVKGIIEIIIVLRYFTLHVTLDLHV